MSDKMCLNDHNNAECKCPDTHTKIKIPANAVNPGNPDKDYYFCSYDANNQCSNSYSLDTCSCDKNNLYAHCRCPPGKRKYFVPMASIDSTTPQYDLFKCCPMSIDENTNLDPICQGLLFPEPKAQTEKTTANASTTQPTNEQNAPAGSEANTNTSGSTAPTGDGAGAGTSTTPKPTTSTTPKPATSTPSSPLNVKLASGSSDGEPLMILGMEWWKFALIVLAILLVLGGIGYYFMRRRRGYGGTGFGFGTNTYGTGYY